MLKRLSPKGLKIRTGDGPVLEGYGFCFNEITEDGVFGKERFAPDVKIDFPKKCFLLRDHDRSKVLARRGKNLTVEKDKEGLFFSVDKLPDTPLAQETRELIKKDIIQDVSIGFMDVDSEVKDDVRTYKHITLHELSILPWGYYESGQVTARERKKILYPPECIL